MWRHCDSNKDKVQDAQYEFYDRNRFSKRYKPFKTVSNGLSNSGFMPSKFIRVFDLVVVKGSQVNEGYCALSYTWNRTGRTFYDPARVQHIRTDEGVHEVISYVDIFPDMLIPRYKAWDTAKSAIIYSVFEIMDNNNEYFANTIKCVKFEDIIQ
ncbi:hypothetical protein BDA99DRAFT_531849 [Phascolomyces articulosus]|uniref:Uncharacterized protein n=1 Tax=Phascolomyces articulosus TaxID=60185 RepID=A0AAD5PJ19_9FUNG|nr:hypothetical protein BDA99DRAFT_531849 [Phascolomyces articulosus]